MIAMKSYAAKNAVLVIQGGVLFFLAVTLPQTMLVTTRRIAAAKPHLIEAYLKTMVEAIAVTFDPANKELVVRLLASNLRLTNPGDAEDS